MLGLDNVSHKIHEDTVYNLYVCIAGELPSPNLELSSIFELQSWAWPVDTNATRPYDILNRYSFTYFMCNAPSPPLPKKEQCWRATFGTAESR